MSGRDRRRITIRTTRGTVRVYHTTTTGRSQVALVLGGWPTRVALLDPTEARRVAEALLAFVDEDTK